MFFPGPGISVFTVIAQFPGAGNMSINGNGDFSRAGK
jgi:hypothetical protein